MTDISNKDSEQDVKIAVIDSTLENATRRMELIHKRIDRTDERITKLNEDVRERIRALEKWVWGAGAVIASLVTVFGIYSNVHTVPTFAEAEHKHGSYITTFDFLKWSNITK